MLPQPALIAALQTHWRDQLAVDVPTLFPGVQADTRHLAAWYELWIDPWSHPPRRHQHPESIQLAVTVHAFARGNADLAQAHRLADAARAALEHQTIPIHDRTQSDEPLLGHVTIHEPEIRNLTRTLAPQAGDHLQHLVYTFPATAQET